MKTKYVAVLLICLFILCSCAAKETDVQTKTIYAMDTVMDITAYGDNAGIVLTKAEDEIKRLSDMFDRGNENSEIFSVNNVDTSTVSPETAYIIKKAFEISEETDGAFDITVAPVMDLWGFYTKEFRVPGDNEIKEALSKVGYGNIQINGNEILLQNGAQIDLGGIAKGYLSDRIKDIFKECGAESGIISLGGNVWAVGEKPGGGAWRVAVQDPDDTNGYIGKLEVRDKAVITSGGYRRFFERDGKKYHHIINTKTGMPAQSGLKSVTVAGNDALTCDALSTAFFVMGLEKSCAYLETHAGFDAVFMTDSGKIYITEGIKDIFSSQREYIVISKP